ncbi:MAG TPA: hypothetical protein VKU19_15615 [Bryobacteraceae bacterium]|nr:hypothetical protein [Bryobacteraceae bacterium]
MRLPMMLMTGALLMTAGRVSAQTGWRHVAPAPGGISFDMPDGYQELTRPFQMGTFSTKAHIFMRDTGVENMAVTYFESDEPFDAASCLRTFRDDFAANGTLTWDRDLQMGESRGKWVKGTLKGKAVEMVVMVVGQRVYQVLFYAMSYLTELLDSARFFNSVRFYTGNQVCGLAKGPDGNISTFCERR